jgi:hypothetical protein
MMKATSNEVAFFVRRGTRMTRIGWIDTENIFDEGCKVNDCRQKAFFECRLSFYF